MPIPLGGEVPLLEIDKSFLYNHLSQASEKNVETLKNTLTINRSIDKLLSQGQNFMQWGRRISACPEGKRRSGHRSSGRFGPFNCKEIAPGAKGSGWAVEICFSQEGG